ncbi:reverse transcriptase family protein [Dysgonomonas sp. 520]|uniref:reverse transcriptase family protein n=1 Tax=Dysgonomonas sp. 520 TaxID=2302931 RepID=UPI001C86A603|nr:reverse transcriptase family protein [Dysgonomonas sp. 520]NDW09330.1 RNA-directed DNA polymerase [Dysgonomonas sp. 520]
MTSSMFSKIHFPSVIGFEEVELKELIKFIDNQYREWDEIKFDKKTNFPKTYKDGTIKKRTIRPSKAKLNLVQRKTRELILSKIELPTNVHGGRKKHSNITNAKSHQGKKYILTTDLKDFYPSVSHKTVYNTFIDLGFNKQSSFYLTRFTTWKKELPQGTPTSTDISNIIFLKTDLELIELCNERQITYTRYIDDLTFSAPFDFQNSIKDIIDIIKASKLKISWRKTIYEGKQTVTGIIPLLNKITAPEKILKKVEEEKQLPDNFLKPYTNYNNNIKKISKQKKK